jgi:DNA helicase HerA-like ATPase
MAEAATILIGKAQDGPVDGTGDGTGEGAVGFDLRFANRHGLVAGATGTGKSVTLQVLAESFSRNGVPVFLADVKGDLSGLAAPAAPSEKLHERARLVGLGAIEGEAAPVVFWDVFGKEGHPVRATVSEMGPLLLSRLLGLNDTQEGVLQVVFAVADDQGLLLLDLKDLRAMLTFVSDNAKDLRARYGNVGAASVGAIQRQLLGLERQGAEAFFGEPAIAISDLMQCDAHGRGHVHILAAAELVQRPALYSTFLLWLLSELFEELPEVGDVAKPRLVFFFDEAHLLFDDAPKILLDKIEQLVRLIRSKGVGVYFVTQSPTDLPDAVLGQLGNRIQHALRAFTASDQKAVRAAASTFRANPAFKTEEAITALGVGEALVSTLEGKGTPTVVRQVVIRPPASRIGPVDGQTRAALIAAGPFAGRYDLAIDRQSAYEVLAARTEAAAQEEQALAAEKAQAQARPSARTTRTTRSRGEPDGFAEAFAKSAMRSASRQLGTALARGLLGSLFKGR